MLDILYLFGQIVAFVVLLSLGIWAFAFLLFTILVFIGAMNDDGDDA